MDGDAILYSSVVLYRHGRWVALWHLEARCGRFMGAAVESICNALKASFVGYKCLQPYLGMGSYSKL